MADLADRVRERSLAEHRGVVSGVVDCADAVAAGFEAEFDGAPATADRRRVAEPMRTVLSRAGLLAAFPTVLEDVVAAAGEGLPARPVAAPPYVVVGSTGPILRATLPAGRLVIEIRTFEPVSTGCGATLYVRRGRDPEDVLEVSLR